MVKLTGRHKKTEKGGSYDVVCVGRVAQDTLMSGDIFNPVCAHGICYEHIPLGSKLKVDNLTSAYGGNAFNASITFARQKLDVGLVAQIGTDAKSQEILKIIKEEKISTELIFADLDVKIPQSNILIAPNGERAILAYAGSDTNVHALLSYLDSIDTRWLYVSSVGSMELLQGVFNFAKLNQVNVAFNPGGVELENIDQVKSLLEDVSVLVLNKQEAISFFGNLESAGLCQAAAEYVETVVVTDGPNGATAYDGKDLYAEPISDDVPVVDRNGAGDAFSSGLVSGLAHGLSLKESLSLGSQNSTSVVQQVGAHVGILRRSK